MIIYSVTESDLNDPQENKTIASFRNNNDALNYVASIKFLNIKISELFDNDDARSKNEAKKLILILNQLNCNFKGVGNQLYNINENVLKE